MSASAAYPPLDTLKPVADGVWIVDGAPMRAGGLLLPVRMTVVRLSAGGVLLFSPTRCSPELLCELDALGPVEHLVAPSMGHWLHLAEWQRACPKATTWAVPGLRARRQVKASGIRIDADLGPSAPQAWRDDIDQVLLRAPPFAEADLFHRASGTLMIADLVLNLEAARLPPLTRLLAHLLGILAPDGRAPLYLRLLIRANRRAACAAAERLVGFEPRRVIVSHGRPIERDAAAELRRRFAWLCHPVAGMPRPVATGRALSAAGLLTLAALGLLLGGLVGRGRTRRSGGRR